MGPLSSRVCDLFTAEPVSAPFSVFDPGMDCDLGLSVATVCVVCEGGPVLGGVDVLLLDWEGVCPFC